MKRTLSLVLALVMVLGSFSAVFAAEEEVVNEAAEILYDLGILREYRLDDQLERRDAVILLARLLGEEEEAKEFEAEGYPTWEDNTDPFYDGYLAWAEVNGYFEGVAEGKFSPRTHLTAQDFSLVLLRALGYDVKGHDAWKKALETAEEAGLLVDLEVEEKDVVSRGLMAVLVLNTLKAEVVGEGVTLAEKLGYELPEEVPAELEIVSVTADNLKEVKVVFNQEVDEETVVNANFTVKGKKATVALKEDGVTAVVTLEGEDKLDNQKEYTLVVDKVKAATGVEIEKTEVKFKAFDASLPEVVDLEVTGPRHLTLTFSEPLNEKVKGKVTIKQGKASLGNNVEVKGNKVHVTAYTNFTEDKEYEVTVENFVDYAGYKNVIEVLTFTYEKDETPPVATVEKVEQEYVIVSFNKPVKGLQKENFYHTFTAWDAEDLKDMNGKEVNKSSSVDKVKVIFYTGDEEDRAIPAGNTVFGIKGKDIKDNWGNALGNVEFTISASADKTAPEVVSIEVKEDNQLKITFSKEVEFGRENIKILDEDGKKISGLYISNVTPNKEAAKEFTVKYNKDLAGEVVTVTIEKVKDTTLYKNELDLYTEVIEIADTSRPSVKKDGVTFTNKKNGDEYIATITVQFNKKVDPETALDISNYSIVKDSTVYLLDGEAEFDVIDSRVKLTLTEKCAKELHNVLVVDEENPAKLQIINVKDLAGNVIIPAQHIMRLEDEESIVGFTVKAVSTTRLEVEFDTLLLNVDPKYFAVVENVYDKHFTLTQLDDETKTTLIFDLDKDKAIKHDKSNAFFAINENNNIEDVFGKAVKFDNNVIYAKDIVDKIQPEVDVDTEKDKYQVSYAKYDVKEEGKDKVEEVVKIVFTEEMDINSFSTGSFKVEGRTVERVRYASENGKDKENVIELVLKPLTEKPTGTVYATVSYEYDVKDKAGNVLDLDKGGFVEIEIKY